jgi:GT2 family glycosyltransferase/ubiquinone/menaquinone biosynthesis C-methylase UbiE/glycosyltransferase involved in cell wall biosynthesis
MTLASDRTPSQAADEVGNAATPMRPVPNGQFAVLRPDNALGFTGERMTTDIGGQIAYEHYHRYCMARDLVVGRDVLDVASGEGYGSALLAGVARSVVGVEVDPAAVRHARAAYDRPNLRFLEGDATRMQLPDACVDAVVSFETLEHLQDQEAFLAEIRRVLRPGGLLLISTPDRHVYSAPGQPPNRYHVLELTPPEFSRLLGRHFANHRILAQRAVLGSVLAPMDGAQGGWRTYDSRNDELIEAQPGLSRAFYLIALASDAPLPAIGSSLFANTISIDDLLAAARVRPNFEARWRDAERRESSARQDLAVARREAASLMAQIEAMRTSMSWRLMGPVRKLGRRFHGLARFGGRALRVTYWTLTGQLSARLRDRRARLEAFVPPGTDLRVALDLPLEPRPLPDPASISLPAAAGRPRVSVIIPTYGQVDFTLRCLASIAAAPPAVPVEVIVVDDASPDPDVAKLGEVKGLRLLRWPSNLGFLRSCNAAAKQAEGDYLFFLNNDTELLPDAVDALVRLLEARPEAGLAGSKLIYPDGRLQEAGGIIWRDGSAWNYGNRDDPRKPQYNYVREVDYVSGAAIMLPRARWEEMGGFDEAFLPAYCEDSDLAFRLRRAGWKVLYQPRSVVVHHEGASHGTDTNVGIKSHQAANTRRLFERWRETLEADSLPNGERVMRARDRAKHRPVTLVVDHYVPEPDRDAGSRTMLAFMDALLAAGHAVKFLPFNMRRTEDYADRLEQRGIEVIHGPWVPNIDAWLIANGAEVDWILLSRPSVAVPLLATLRAHCSAPVIFYGHDLHFARMASEPGANAPESRERIAAMEAQERLIWRLVDVALYPSEEEAARARSMEPWVRVRSVPAYALPRRETRTVAPDGGMLFVGGFRHKPNEDAALWLAREIMRALRRRVPDVSLAIIGSNPTPAVLALAGEGVEVRGFVPDEELDAAYATARVALCPLRYGAGVKLKVVEAMHRGVPVVTTPVGAQGLPGLSAVCDIANTAEALAEAAARLLTDDAHWLERSAAQSGYVLENFSPEAMQSSLLESFEVARAAR